MGFWIIFIIIWLFWAILCANMASARGKNGILGFFAGLIFGIFAVIYYLMTKPETHY